MDTPPFITMAPLHRIGTTVPHSVSMAEAATITMATTVTAESTAISDAAHRRLRDDGYPLFYFVVGL